MAKTRIPKREYFEQRLKSAEAAGYKSKADYYRQRLSELDAPSSAQDFITAELAQLERSIVATPISREYLESFAEANNGSSDLILTQMAFQFGYKMALDAINAKL